MTKAVIGISGNNREFPNEVTQRYVAASELANGVHQVGGIPIVIVVGTPDIVKEYIDRIDKLILSGWSSCWSKTVWIRRIEAYENKGD